jgi:hypothetical protein
MGTEFNSLVKYNVLTLWLIKIVITQQGKKKHIAFSQNSIYDTNCNMTEVFRYGISASELIRKGSFL